MGHSRKKCGAGKPDLALPGFPLPCSKQAIDAKLMIVRALVNGRGLIWREETSAAAAKEFPTQKIRFHLFVGYNKKNNQMDLSERMCGAGPDNEVSYDICNGMGREAWRQGIVGF
jgi:hypothetical protein